MRISAVIEDIVPLEKSAKIIIEKAFVELPEKSHRSRNVFVNSLICESVIPSGTGNSV